MSESSNIALLLQQGDWIHSLARSLVRDPDLAADATQDTWVTALEARPATDRPVRGWLATVLRHHVGRARRGESRRQVREEAAAQEERTESTFDVLAKAKRSRDLSEAVLELDEPYRETILLRYFENLTYRDIAERTGVTPATVNSRVTRGLAKLRVKLDGRHGDRRTWVRAFLPFLPIAESAKTLAPGALSMTTVTQISLVVAASSSALLAAWNQAPPEPISPLADHVAAAVPPAAESVALAAPVELIAEDGVREAVHAGPTDLLGEVRLPAADGDTWEIQLSAEHPLGGHLESVHVSSGAGDVEVRRGEGSNVLIEAHVRANLQRAQREHLTSYFEDHVLLEETAGTLEIHDLHCRRKDEGWTVDLILHLPRAMSIEATSGAGDVSVKQGAGDVQVSSGAGDVEVLLPNQEVHSMRATSGAGDVLVRVGAVHSALEGTSGAGDVEVRLARFEHALDARLTSGAGDVDLVAPANLSGHFDLRSEVGSVDIPANFGLAIERGTVGARARGDVGVGESRFELKTSAGSISISAPQAGAR